MRKIRGCLALLFCLLPAWSGMAQSGNPLRVDLSIWPPGRTNFQAQAEIKMMVVVNMDGPHQDGDAVKVEVFANGKRISKETSYWHPEQRPRPGRDLYLHITPAHFDAIPVHWSDPPVGHYALTARAAFSKTVKAVSAPANIIVSP